MLAMFNENQAFQNSINFTSKKDQHLSEHPFVMSNLQNNNLWLIALSYHHDFQEGSDGFYQLMKHNVATL
jgi:hypothetical protein